ncbi:MAG: hypothetical protein ACOYJG_06195 [Prevotella sp.]
MRRTVVIALIALFCACSNDSEPGAEVLVRQIDSLYAAKNYQQTLDSIESFRLRFPKNIEGRRHALDVWQKASLDMTRQQVGLTDSALQATQRQLKEAHSIYDRNMLSMKRDSLQSRYDALCAQVRYILMKQKEYQSKHPNNEKTSTRH